MATLLELVRQGVTKVRRLDWADDVYITLWVESDNAQFFGPWAKFRNPHDTNAPREVLISRDIATIWVPYEGETNNVE